MPQINWNKWALPLLIVLSIVVRFGTFFPSVINHDESTYILIGSSLLEGDVYLQDSFDTKPVGIFLIYAFMALLTGGSIFGMRLLTAVVIGVTAWLLYLFGKKIIRHEKVGWAASLSYIIICSIFTYYGLSPNTELFFLPFTFGAFLLAWPKNQHWLYYVLAGLLLGCGFMIKYVVAADALALGLLLLYMGWKNGNWMRAIFAQCAPLTLAFFIPLFITYGYYRGMGLSEAFLFYTLEVTSRYPEDVAIWDRILFIGDFFLRFFPLVLLAIWAWRNKKSLKEQFLQKFILFWLICDLVMILIPGKSFGHYQIQLMPMLCLLAAFWFHPDRLHQEKLRSFLKRHRTIARVLLFGGLSVGLCLYYMPLPDYPQMLSQRLKQELKQDEQVYIGNYHHIVYHLLGQKPLTPYVHSSLLYYEHHIEALGIDLETETNRIFNEIQPRFAVLRITHPDSYLTRTIHKEYHIIDTLPGKILLFSRNQTIQDE